MKLTKLSATVAMSVLFLTGCDQAAQAYQPTSSEVDSATRTKLNQDDAELKQALKDAQAKDPTVKDMYYSINDKGEKELNIVREVKDPKTGESSAMSQVWPLLGGMAAGMLISQMMQGGGMRGGYAPSGSYNRSYDDERRRKNTAMSGYAGYTRNNAVRSFTNRSTTSKSKSFFSSSSSSASRSSGAFSSSSSARSSGYSSGG